MHHRPMAPAYADAGGKRAMQEEGLAHVQSELGDLHPATLIAKNNLGATLLNMGCAAQARELMESTWRDCRQGVGKHHPATLKAMENLALALQDDCDLERAHALQKKVLKWRRRALGEQHPETQEALGNLAIIINNMAVALRNAGCCDAAMPLQIQALGIVVTVYGAESLIAATSYSAYGALLKRMGQGEEACRYFQKSLAIRQRELGADAELCQLVQSRLRAMLH
jgi:tetratricopeptide (TPR) repeat protein